MCYEKCEKILVENGKKRVIKLLICIPPQKFVNVGIRKLLIGVLGVISF